MKMSISKDLVSCELCLTKCIPKASVQLNRFEYVFYNFLQRIFENFSIDVPVNEIQNRMCPGCADKILTMCEDLESWRAAQTKRITVPKQDHETVVVKLEPPETEAELEQDLTSYEDIELAAVKLESETDRLEESNTEAEDLLTILDSSTSNKTHGIHYLSSNVVHNVRRFNCNHPECTASFAYKRSFQTHIQKCHLNLKTCRKLNITCTTHVRKRARKNFYRGVGSIQDYHYNDCGQGHFIKMENKPMQKNQDAPKKKPRPKREIKLCHYDGKGLGRFISLNSTKTL